MYMNFGFKLSQKDQNDTNPNSHDSERQSKRTVQKVAAVVVVGRRVRFRAAHVVHNDDLAVGSLQPERREESD